MKPNAIIIYEKKVNIYEQTLNRILDDIKTINVINKEITLGYWDSNIKYRRSWDRSISNLDPSYYLERNKWIDFIFSARTILDNISNQLKLNPFTIEELIISKLRVSLLLFWRDIVNNLNSDTIFKLQLKLIISFTTEYQDQNLISSNESKNIQVQLGIGRFDQVRSIGDVKLYSKKDFYKAFEYIKNSLLRIVDNYS